ncbi:hypothetical protein HDU67_000762 [Dinochytrium kinnereticum]|nr:hypothetical protein HDU67_000762 [Dinochytrium kinnereticum]
MLREDDVFKGGVEVLHGLTTPGRVNTGVLARMIHAAEGKKEERLRGTAVPNLIKLLDDKHWQCCQVQGDVVLLDVKKLEVDAVVEQAPQQELQPINVSALFQQGVDIPMKSKLGPLHATIPRASLGKKTRHMTAMTTGQENQFYDLFRALYA